MMRDPKIEFLFWRDCPSHAQALALLQKVIAEAGASWTIDEIEVLSEQDAVRLQFPGSPTIRVDGSDIDPEGASLMEIALTCRLYRLEDGRPSPLPSKEMIQRALGIK
jgi:hypothetical protein